jgi:hypothetical protein
LTIGNQQPITDYRSLTTDLNYFNYFTEIEEEFVRQRGSHLLISPLDWSLIETWKQRQIPLHVVLRGISNSFASYDPRLRRGRKVNSLFYCQQEVDALFLEYLESRTGENPAVEASGESSDKAATVSQAVPDNAAPFSREAIIEYLTEQREIIHRLSINYRAEAALAEMFRRAARRLEELSSALKDSLTIRHEQLETDLTLIEEFLLAGLRQNAGEETLSELQREADAQLRSYRKGMTPEIYQQTRENFIARKLREQHRVPRLSLFYL